ncbi:MAG: lipopolysaccharide transport periplasmic protein LptA [Rhodanobacteraceae bacterium]|nr:MAG: lipopolysaccharide transport periplasmic protein LptA [Rhodanobacteraceae bacterium]
MSTPRSRHTRARTDLLLVLVAALGCAGAAQAKQSDKTQPINITADAFAGSQDSGKITFTGKVAMDQGTFHADGAKAVGYTDPNDTSQWQRVVLTGTPAHFQQTQDNGTLVHGQALTLDYKVSENTVILTGDASVVQQGRGEFHGNQLAYDTDTGAIKGSASGGGRVHITLQPRTKPAPASTAKPAAAGNAVPAPSTSTASAPVSASSPTARPAPAATAAAPAASGTP